MQQVKENDVFVQKSYDVYRGFVQLRQIIYEPLPPQPPPTSKKPGAVPAAAAAAPAAAPAPAPVQAPVESPADDGEPLEEGQHQPSAADVEMVDDATLTEASQPAYQIKIVKLAELLITFTKVCALFASL